MFFTYFLPSFRRKDFSLFPIKIFILCMGFVQFTSSSYIFVMTGPIRRPGRSDSESSTCESDISDVSSTFYNPVQLTDPMAEYRTTMVKKKPVASRKRRTKLYSECFRDDQDSDITMTVPRSDQNIICKVSYRTFVDECNEVTLVYSEG